MDCLMEKEEIIRLRDKHIGGNLSVSYGSSPLHIVRGRGAYLYDDRGEAYLDCVNNVCHLGHCHPKVVEACYRQMSLLNTNTRYLHANLVTYAQRLAATMPPPLQVVYVVNSGSEANDLALRMARTYTKRTDIICIESAYHGNTQAGIEVSPYKYEGRGGFKQKDYIHKVPMPDVYRGRERERSKAGACYAKFVKEAVAEAGERGVAAFIAESVLGCGGQVVLPPGYLQEAYSYVREGGGVCIADEVQVGLGRVGSHFWGFQTQDVTPDIVTIGKPAGNGFPLAAVVCTPEIAKAFDNGMEYFNTFGGSPVACAVGLAVLDVIEEEGLQAHALKVGKYFLGELRGLQSKHPMIGDVRGVGLFIGVELVHDRETLEPAGDVAECVALRMRERHVLISTDGPFHNVLKIKPPMVFSEENADEVVKNLDEILEELASPVLS